MERSRRNRRGRGRSHVNLNVPHANNHPQPSKAWSFLNNLYSFLIMSSLIALIYLMLKYHCTNNCRDNCDIKNITRNIEDISKNLSIIKNGYYDLELKISRFSQDLPKLEGQIDILEALANSIERPHLTSWDPITQLPLPNVDIFYNSLAKVQSQNTTGFCERLVSETVETKED